MVNHIWLVSHTNPEPWAIGTISHKRMSPNPNLDAFKRAVRGEFEDHGMLPEGFRKFTFYFFRQQARYLDMGDKVRQRNQADATNMQKALEDALQGVLYGNDRDTLDIRAVIADQGPHVKSPGTIIRCDKVAVGSVEDWRRRVCDEIPPRYVTELDLATPPMSDNVWRGPGK